MISFVVFYTTTNSENEHRKAVKVFVDFFAFGTWVQLQHRTMQNINVNLFRTP